MEKKVSPLVRVALRVLPYALLLYAIASLTTMAGMEIFGWLSSLLVLFVLVAQIRRPPEERLPFYFIPFIDIALIGILGVVAVGAALADPSGSGFWKIFGAVRWVLLFMLVRTGISWAGSRRFGLIASFLVGLFTLISVYAIVQHFTGIDLIRDSQRAVPPFYYGDGRVAYRVSGLFSSPMTWGHAAAMFICYPAALFALGARRHTGFHRFFGISILIVGLAIILSFTRGAWVGAAAGLLVVGLYAGRRMLLILLAGLAVTAGAVYALSPDVRARVAVSFDPNYASNKERLTIWSTNLEMFKDHPILGVGYGENELLIGSYYEKLGITDALKGHAHSNYLQWLSGTGLSGFILYLAFIFGMLWVSHRAWKMIPAERPEERALVLGVIGSQVAMHVGGLTECNFKDAEVNHQFMFSLALVWAIYHLYAQEHYFRVVRPKQQPLSAVGI